MYAAHFAAGLAVKGRAPRAPIWALLTAAFLPDFFWIGFSAIGLEPANSRVFFDDWSHSLLSVTFEATVFAMLFYRRSLAVWLPIWIAGLSHFLLDLPIHPKPLALYPHAAIHAPWDLWNWATAKGLLGITPYWWGQLAVVGVLLAIYATGAKKSGIPKHLVAASCVSILGLHLLV
jgi:hypothetical protein